jgi:hypothetical protein
MPCLGGGTSPKHKPLLLKKKNPVVNCSITAQLVANKSEARQWTYAERLSNCWNCPLQWAWWRGEGGNSYIYTCVSIYVYLISQLCLKQYTLYETQLSQEEWKGKVESVLMEWIKPKQTLCLPSLHVKECAVLYERMCICICIFILVP